MSSDLTLILYFILIGWTNAMTAIAIDFGSKYGHLLGFIRLWRVRRAIKKLPDKDEYETRITNGKYMPFSERIDHFNDIYWDVATYSFWLPVWLCVKCGSYRIFFFVWIVASIWMGLNWFDWIRLLFVGAAANMATIMILAGKKTELTVKHENACSV